MTLPELAALAAKVEGFVRPTQICGTCGGQGDATPGWHYTKCECEAGDGREWDNHPAVLFMAVVRAVRKSDRFSRFDVLYGAILCEPCHDTEVEVVSVHGDDNEESIARAALVALLRAHGVEVPE